MRQECIKIVTLLFPMYWADPAFENALLCHEELTLLAHTMTPWKNVDIDLKVTKLQPVRDGAQKDVTVHLSKPICICMFDQNDVFMLLFCKNKNMPSYAFYNQIKL